MKISNIFKGQYLLLTALLLSLVGCQNSDIDRSIADGEGAVTLSLTRGDISELEEPINAVVRIYNAANRVVARYTTDEIPEVLYLAAGNYKITAFLGDYMELSNDMKDLYYYGEQDFVVENGIVGDLNLNCTVQNSVVAIEFDQTVYDRFELETTAYLSLANEFSREGALDGSIPTLAYTEDGVGLVMLPEGVDNIAWGFYGESANIDPTTQVESKIAEFSGVIANPTAATLYTLRFAYTRTPDGYMDIVATIDEDVDEFNDNIGFSPQPTIVGEGFDVESKDLVFAGEDINFNIKSLTELGRVELSYNNQNVTIFEAGTPATHDGISFISTGEKSGTLTLSSALFNSYTTAGSKKITITAATVDESQTVQDVEIGVSGMNSSTSIDAWSCTMKLGADVHLNNATEVKFAYRIAGSEEWSELAAQQNENGEFTAAIEPTWEASQNAKGLTVYTLTDGVKEATTYEYKLIVDGLEFPTNSITTAARHTIPNGDMQSDPLLAFGTSSSSSTNWASGNNSFVGGLCSESNKGGSRCAILTSKSSTVFAAGNLNYGQFVFASFSGTMKFGQPFNWQSRPKTFKFDYAAIVGDETHDSDDNVLDGKDKARVFFAIVDWKDRHSVTVGATGNATGTWDPATQTSTSEGNIIGYASLLIEESVNTQDSEGLIDAEVPIYYYDTTTKPSGKIAIIISCASSAYGDYLAGSTASRLWVDNFELGY